MTECGPSRAGVVATAQLSPGQLINCDYDIVTQKAKKKLPDDWWRTPSFNVIASLRADKIIKKVSWR